MQPELALQKLNEVKAVVDGDVEELVDAVARLIVLQTDVSNPMYGAHITYIGVGWDQEYDDDDEEWDHRVLDDIDFYDPDGYPVKAHRAIVFEPGVHSAGAEEMWDPNRQEWKLPSDYPMGSVNAVYGKQGPLTEEYNYDVTVQTSIVPAKDARHPERYSYVPGWDPDLPSEADTEPDELPWTR